MKTKKLALTALLIAIALILSYVEALVPLPFPVPGIKLGLPNIAVMFALYKLGARRAVAISIFRVFLVSLLFGNLFSFAFSIAGAALSLLTMTLLHRSKKFSCAGVSVAGAASHNIAQIAVAAVILNSSALVLWLPALCISAVISGIIIGAVSASLIGRINIQGESKP